MTLAVMVDMFDGSLGHGDQTMKKNRVKRSRSHWRIRALVISVSILLIPLIAMQFTDEVNWDLADFVIFGALLFGAGFTFDLAAQKTGDSAYKLAVGLAILAAFLLVWINGAVGIIGNESNDANLMYFGVLSVGLIGVFIVRFEPEGMAKAMFATAAAQVLVFLVALVAGWGFTGPITLIFVALWVISGRLFQQAASAAASPEAWSMQDS